jgi:hypothetical protein
MDKEIEGTDVAVGAVGSEGEPVEALSRRLGLPVYKLEEWRQRVKWTPWAGPLGRCS